MLLRDLMLLFLPLDPLVVATFPIEQPKLLIRQLLFLRHDVLGQLLQQIFVP